MSPSVRPDQSGSSGTNRSQTRRWRRVRRVGLGPSVLLWTESLLGGPSGNVSVFWLPRAANGQVSLINLLFSSSRSLKDTPDDTSVTISHHRQSARARGCCCFQLCQTGVPRQHKGERQQGLAVWTPGSRAQRHDCASGICWTKRRNNAEV